MAQWIWFPCEFEMWLLHRVSLGRRERGRLFPVAWRLEQPYESVRFQCEVELDAPMRASIAVQGDYHAELDGSILWGDFTDVEIPAGRHTVALMVYNGESFPAIFCEDGPLATGEGGWRVTVDYGNYLPAACGAFDCADTPPDRFALCRERIEPVHIERRDGLLLADFGREVMGYPIVQASSPCRATLYYGESEPEACDNAECEHFDHVELAAEETVLPQSRAMRYLAVRGDAGAVEGVALDYEYAPVTESGEFSCPDELLCRIWEVSRYTLRLNTREFLLDGIKRDRWVWMGDVCQSALMSYYTYAEPDAVRRSLVAVRGKEPTTMHINRIVDYSLYWFIGLADYVRYTGDESLISLMYPRIVSLMEFCISCAGEDGFLRGRAQDWVFIDWADIDKDGAVCVEQILFWKSLLVTAEFARRMDDSAYAAPLEARAAALKARIIDTFYDPERHVLYHNLVNGEVRRDIKRHAAIFAVKCGLLEPEELRALAKAVLLNPEVPAITTPYMKLYELEALCEAGERDAVLPYLREYWGGMLALGATTIWEQFDPNEQGEEHYRMYGRKYGRSLCHAWGAGPLYLLGKYYLGVRPTADGYTSYEIAPNRGDLPYIEGAVPVPWGQLRVRLDEHACTVEGCRPGGTLRLKCGAQPVVSGGKLLRFAHGEAVIRLSDAPCCVAF